MSDFEAKRKHMVEGQVRANDVTDRVLVQAMREIPRERFLPKSKRACAYAEMNVEVAPGRYLIEPRDFSKLFQALEPRKSDIALDIACGRGYSSAVLARMVETVVGLEDDPALVEKAGALLSDIGADNAVVIEGDLKAGAPDQGPFDIIAVNGAVIEPPRPWFDQLADGGRLGGFEIVGGGGKAVLYGRDGGAVGRRELFDAHAPLLPGFEPEPAFQF